jgi:PKD repeat protein
VLSAPVANFTATPTSGTAPLAVSFTDTSTGYPTSWFWTFGDGATSTEQNPSHSYAAAGVYDVSLRATNAAGSNTKLRSGYLTVAPPPPTQTFLPTADAYVKSSRVNSNYGTSSEVRVKTDDTTYKSFLRFNVGGLANPWVISAKLRLYVTNGSNDGGSLYVAPTGWTEGGITWANAPSIGGAPIATGTATSSGQWREIDVTSVVRGAGTYDFALAGGSSNSAYYSSRQGANPPQLLVQTSPPTVPVADFAGTPTQGPAPLAVQFTDLTAGGPTSWLWTFGDGTSSTLQHPSKTYANAGVYNVTLRATNSLGTNTRARSGYVQVSNPLPPVADFSGTPLSGFAPLQVAFSDLSSGAPTSWLWTFGDGTTSTLKNPSKTYTTHGSYQVTLQVTNVAGTNARVRAGYVNVAAGKIVTAAADAKTSFSKPTVNYGSASDLRVRAGSGPYRSYLRVDVSGLTGPVSRARLRLYVDGGSDDGGTVYSLSNAWSEGSITWNTAPPLGPAFASFGAVDSGNWVELDITPAINGNGIFSFGMASTTSDSAYYGSRESAHPPQLVIETAW